MKRTVFATGTVVTAAMLMVGVAGPAAADNPYTVSAENPTDVGYYIKAVAHCTESETTELADYVGPNQDRGEVPSCNTAWGVSTHEYSLKIASDEQWAAGRWGLLCTGFISSTPFTSALMHTSASFYESRDICDAGDVRLPMRQTGYLQNFSTWGKNDAGVYNWTITPSANSSPDGGPATVAGIGRFTYEKTAIAAADINVGGGLSRAKTSERQIINPRKLRAMAKRFVNEPGGIINIHAYGPDRARALTRAGIVVTELKDSIRHQGGDSGAYPIEVTYAGNPDHKKGVHVTIHQHTELSVTVPEGGTLTIGGNS